MQHIKMRKGKVTNEHSVGFVSYIPISLHVYIYLWKTLQSGTRHISAQFHRILPKKKQMGCYALVQFTLIADQASPSIPLPAGPNVAARCFLSGTLYVASWKPLWEVPGRSRKQVELIFLVGGLEHRFYDFPFSWE